MINRIKNHKALIVVIAVFVALCVVLSISLVREDESAAEKKLQQGNAAVAAQGTGMVNGIKSGLKGLLNFRGTARENEELKEQIEELEKEIADITLSQNELSELRRLSSVLNYESVVDKYIPITGNIVAYDSSDLFNVFTIDRGTESGIRKNCIVLSGNGLVGRVLETGKGFSKIISVTDEDVNVSFQVLSDPTIMGILTGSGDEILQGYTFDGSADIQEGDEVLTTNIGIYPEGIEIGKVIEVRYDKDTQLKTVTVEPAVSFKSMKRVVVLAR